MTMIMAFTSIAKITHSRTSASERKTPSLHIRIDFRRLAQSNTCIKLFSFVFNELKFRWKSKSNSWFWCIEITWMGSTYANVRNIQSVCKTNIWCCHSSDSEDIQRISMISQPDSGNEIIAADCFVLHLMSVFHSVWSVPARTGANGRTNWIR